jgi:hypothetical protein
MTGERTDDEAVERFRQELMGRPVSEVVHRFGSEFPRDRLTLGDIIAVLDERAFGLLMIILGLPVALPTSAIPFVSTLFGVPLMIIAAQLMIGMDRPWLPAMLANRSMARSDFKSMADKAMPHLLRVERYLHARWAPLTGYIAERAIGGLCLFWALIVALPIPGANQPPGIAIALFGIALLERDGLFVILGLLVSIAAFAILLAVLGAFAAALWVVFIHVFGA